MKDGIKKKKKTANNIFLSILNQSVDICEHVNYVVQLKIGPKKHFSYFVLLLIISEDTPPLFQICEI